MAITKVPETGLGKPIAWVAVRKDLLLPLLARLQRGHECASGAVNRRAKEDRTMIGNTTT